MDGLYEEEKLLLRIPRYAGEGRGRKKIDVQLAWFT